MLAGKRNILGEIGQRRRHQFDDLRARLGLISARVKCRKGARHCRRRARVVVRNHLTCLLYRHVAVTVICCRRRGYVIKILKAFNLDRCRWTGKNRVGFIIDLYRAPTEIIGRQVENAHRELLANHVGRRHVPQILVENIQNLHLVIVFTALISFQNHVRRNLRGTVRSHRNVDEVITTHLRRRGFDFKNLLNHLRTTGVADVHTARRTRVEVKDHRVSSQAQIHRVDFNRQTRFGLYRVIVFVKNRKTRHVRDSAVDLFARDGKRFGEKASAVRCIAHLNSRVKALIIDAQLVGAVRHGNRVALSVDVNTVQSVVARAVAVRVFDEHFARRTGHKSNRCRRRLRTRGVEQTDHGLNVPRLTRGRVFDGDDFVKLTVALCRSVARYAGVSGVGSAVARVGDADFAVRSRERQFRRSDAAVRTCYAGEYDCTRSGVKRTRECRAGVVFRCGLRRKIGDSHRRVGVDLCVGIF